MTHLESGKCLMICIPDCILLTSLFVEGNCHILFFYGGQTKFHKQCLFLASFHLHGDFYSYLDDTVKRAFYMLK